MVFMCGVYTGRRPDSAAGTYLAVILQSVSRTVVGRTRFVDECRPAGPHQDQRPEQSHSLLHLPQVQLKTALLTGCCFHIPRYQFIRYRSPAHITSCPSRNYVGRLRPPPPDMLRDCHDPPAKCCLLTTAGLKCCGKSTAADLKIPKSADGNQLATGAHKLEAALWRQKRQTVAPKTA